jgi:hypothetical protein
MIAAIDSQIPEPMPNMLGIWGELNGARCSRSSHSSFCTRRGIYDARNKKALSGFNPFIADAFERPIMAAEERHAKKKKLLGGVQNVKP